VGGEKNQNDSSKGDKDLGPKKHVGRELNNKRNRKKEKKKDTLGSVGMKIRLRTMPKQAGHQSVGCQRGKRRWDRVGGILGGKKFLFKWKGGVHG